MRPHSLLPILLLLALVSTAPALATKVNVKYAEADYGSWKTWVFIENAKRLEAREAAEREKIAATIKAAIVENLAKAGYVQATQGQTPDFKVAIDGSMREVFDVRDYHRQISDHVALVMEGGSSSYQEGTLMIRILDGDEVVWTGWITDEISDPESPEKQLRKAVKKILRKFPPKK